MEEHVEQYGKLISKHGKSRFYRGIFVVLAAAFAGAGALVFFSISQIGKKGFQFDGSVSLLYAIGCGGILVAIVILLVGHLLTRNQPTFYLYERAIRAVGRGVDRTDLYEDIEDLFFYTFSQFCYRPSSDAPWIFGDGRMHRIGFLKDKLAELHATYRSEKLLRAIKQGKSATFHCLPESATWSKSLVANTRNMNYPMYSIEVNQQDLKIRDKSIPIQRIADVKTNLWIERAQIVDIDGNVFYQTHSTAIMSLDALYALLGKMQEEHIPSPISSS